MEAEMDRYFNDVASMCRRAGAALRVLAPDERERRIERMVGVSGRSFLAAARQVVASEGHSREQQVHELRRWRELGQQVQDFVRTLLRQESAPVAGSHNRP